MRKSKVRRLEVLATLKENYLRHLKDYRESFEAYKVLMAQSAKRQLRVLTVNLQKLMKDVEAAKVDVDEPVLGLTLSITFNNIKRPMNRSRSYLQAIKMLEMEVEDVIELDVEQFDCFVMDNWDWKEEFESIKMSYVTAKR